MINIIILLFKKIEGNIEDKGEYAMKTIIYGYVRVSTREQCEDRQLIALKAFPVCEENIFVDKISGKDFNRPN